MDTRNDDSMQNQELERYGVWVKAGPEDVVEADEEFGLTDLPSEPDADLEDAAASGAGTGVLGMADVTPDDGDEPDVPDIDDLGDLDDELTLDADEEPFGAPMIPDAEPAAGRDVLEMVTAEEPAGADEAAEQAAVVDSGEAVPTLDDLDLEEPEAEPDPFSGLPDVEEVTLDDAGAELPPLDELDLDDDLDLAGGPDDTPAAGSIELPEAGGSEEPGGDVDEIDLDELKDSLGDDFEEIEIDDEESSDAGGEFGAALPGADEAYDELSLDSIELDDGSSEELPELEGSAEEAADSSDEHEFTPEAQGIEITPSTPSNILTPDEEAFLDTQIDEDALAEGVPGRPAPELHTTGEHAIPGGMEPQEREAFDRIQGELADIKRELAELKAALRAGGAAAVGGAAVAAAYQPEAEDDEAALEPSHGPGFFEEDEDETIALTGDELDNILNTAEFTEQAGEEEELDEELEIPHPPGGGVPAEAPVDETIGDVSLEDIEEGPTVFEGDSAAVDELAEMNIDAELADIESLDDDSEPDTTLDDELGEIEIDLDDIETLDDGEDLLAAGAAEAATEAAAELDRQALASPAEDHLDSATGTDDEDFDSFAETVEQQIGNGDDDLEIEEIDLDEEFDAADAASQPEESAEADLELEPEIVLDEALTEGAPVEPAVVTPEEDELDETETIDLGDDEVFGDDGEIEDDEELEETESIDLGDEHEYGDADELDLTDDLESAAGVASSFAHSSIAELPDDLKNEIRSVLSYMDQLLEALPDDKIEEFAQSEHFEVYKRLFEELGLET